MSGGVWKIEVFRDGPHWRWKLINRQGDLLMVSREKCPSRGGAHLLAQHEVNELKNTELVA